MWLGVAGNIGALAYFKYANFFLGNLGGLLGIHQSTMAIALPLAISFYSFQQVAFIVDTYNREMETVPLKEYLLSVVFFPHLIAGPLLHYQDIITQFKNRFAVSWETFWLGLPVFAVGLAKKTLIADSIASSIAPIFAKSSVALPDFFSAWGAALGYTAQLYFDFSGYSDMAIGLGLMFGIVLPLNFFSPYKATSIIEFWRRWHITLSGFLRDYLYIPMGGGRSGPVRRYANLMTVMLLGGLWHGAAWTFVAWGAFHGALLAANHLWRDNVSSRLPLVDTLLRPVYAPMTFFMVVVAWVFFRAPDFVTAWNVVQAMFGGSVVSLPGEVAYLLGVDRLAGIAWGQTLPFTDFSVLWLMLVIAFAIIWCAPNTAEIFALDGKGAPLTERSLHLSFRTAIVSGVLLWLSCFGIFGSAPSEFLYFQF
ncbi:MBOAT family O-acyltransferase [Bradyrhizobium sp. USDA 241]|uniref:MBOAT family O-acyltransferase n=1 Tax=Bradyrhizobium sp. USDA 241 TaxID=3377725 RepID=UPI003C7866B9